MKQVLSVLPAGILLLTLACSAPAAAPSAGSQDTPRPGGTATYVIRSDPPGWDPWGRTRTFDPTRMTAEMVFNPLYGPATNTGQGCEVTIQPELAESWRYVDDKTFEVKLRQGVKWHNKPPLNGRELVAEDVVFTLEERHKKGPAAQRYVTQVFYDRAEAVDKYTVRVHLKSPFDFFTGFTDGNRQGWITAKEASNPDWLEQPEKSWIGTGPFMFKEFQPGVKVSFEKNPDYFKSGKPYVDKIEALIMPDTSTRLAALRAGQLDIYPAASPGVMADLRRSNPDMYVKSCTDEFHIGVIFRLDKAPWNDVRVRRALSMSLNREAIIKTALHGDGAPTYILWPTNPEALKLEEFPPDVRRNLEYRPDEAKRLLAEAGYPNGLKTNVFWTPGYESPWQEVAEAAVTMMRGGGFDAQVDMKEYAAFLRVAAGRTGTGEYPDIAMGWTQSGSTDDWMDNRWSKTPGPNYLSHVKDAKLDSMIEELWRTLDAKKHRELAKEIQIHLASQMYEVFGPTWGNGVIAGPRVRDLGWRGSNKMYTPLFEQVWLSR